MENKIEEKKNSLKSSQEMLKTSKEPLKPSHVFGLSIVVYIAASLVGSFAAIAVSSYVGEELYFVLSSSIVAAIGGPVIYKLLRDGKLWSFRECEWKTVAAYAVIGMILIYMIDTAMEYVFIVFQLFNHESVKALMETNELGMEGSLLIQIIGIAAAPAILEEMLFRGAIFKALRIKRGFLFSSVVSSLIFGIAHGTVLYAVIAFLFGMALCMVLEITQSMVVPIIIHFCNNCLAILEVRAGFGTGVENSGFESMTMNVIVLGLMIAASIVIFSILMKKVVSLRNGREQLY